MFSLAPLRRRMGDNVANFGDPALPDNVSNGLYRYHEADSFYAGAPLYVFESPFELPLFTIPGAGMFRRPNLFSPLQPSIAIALPQTTSVGIGGVTSGYLALQGLSVPDE